jgi:predicted acetyltransferase
MASALSFRPAREADLERLVDVHTGAYPDSRGREARARTFTQNPLGCLDDLWVASTSDGIVAHAFLFSLEAWVGGVRVRFGGVASVAVAPEARGNGVGTALVEHVQTVARDRGDAATLLYPFRQGYYARLGYAPASSFRRLRFSPRSIPFKCELGIRRASGSDGLALRACWEAAGARGTGALARSERTWHARLLDEGREWFVAEGTGGVEGYIAWTVACDEPHAETTLEVREVAARTAAGERSLWGLVAAQRDQVDEVRAQVAADDALDRALVDADRERVGEADLEHVLGELAAGPSLRLTDVARALAARGWRQDGTVVIGTEDESVGIVVRGGRASVVSGQEAHIVPDLRMGRATLGAVALGSLPMTQASRFGWVEARSDRALVEADALFSLPPYFSPDPF